MATKQIKHQDSPSADLLSRVLLDDDLSKLTPGQRFEYYKSVCETLGLNPLTKPFDYIVLDNKLQLYARKDCTEQLRKRYNISLTIHSRERDEDIYSVIANAKLPDGRVDESIGVAALKGYKDGKEFELGATRRANAMMRAETKAKRRVTLSICGLGIMDETELDTYELDQRPPNEIIERNVRQATANAEAENGVLPEATGSGRVVKIEYKPEEVTEENYKDVVSHVGKAEGELLGRTVGELHPNVINWLYKNWREKLGPNATEDDLRLKKAIELAVKHANGAPVRPVEASKAPPAAQDSTPALTSDVDAITIANKLIEKAQDLILTPDQFCRLLMRQGLLDENKMLHEATLATLKYLETDEGWNTIKQVVEAENKPKVIDKPSPKKRGRSRK